ncbi:MAG: NifU family protein [Candidatus Eremiobacteraeota bacterium]|nr:NifU family protein [Candidatus Eremiobacteraeota bacterium]
MTARLKAEELIRTIVQFYGAGLTRVLEIVDEAAGEASPAIFDRLSADKSVAALLLLHDLHPHTLEERVHNALEGVRPYLKSHEGGVAITEISDGIVYLQMEGSCNGCSASAETVRTAIEQAIKEAAPEIAEVRAQGIREADTGLRIMSDWLICPDLQNNGAVHLDVNGTPAVIVRNEESIHAFRNQCPSCFRGLANAAIAWPNLRCGGCGAQYDLSEKRGAGLERFPVNTDGPKIQLAIPVTT